MCGQITDGDSDIRFPIQFEQDIPPKDYTTCVVFPGIGNGECAVEATEVSTCVPWHFGWSGPSDLHYTDVALVTYDGTRFPAHQVVLASRSPVLDKLFKSQWFAGTDLPVAVDASVTAVESFLRFLYTNSFTSGHAYTNNLTDVLCLAHYYEVEELLRLCGQELLKELSNDTVVDMVVIARGLLQYDTAMGGTSATVMALHCLWKKLVESLQRDESVLDTFMYCCPLSYGGKWPLMPE